MPSKVFGPLPLDVQKLILQRLDGPSLAALSRTCREMNEFVKGPLKFEKVVKKIADLEAAMDKSAGEIEASEKIIDVNKGNDHCRDLFNAAAKKANVKLQTDRKALEALLDRFKDQADLLPKQKATLAGSLARVIGTSEKAAATLARIVKK